MFQRIVVPLDGSPVAEQALPAAREMARLAAAPLHVVRVIDLAKLERAGAYGLGLEYSAFDLVLQEERATCRDYLERIERRLAAEGVQVTTEQREGLAAREILGATRPNDLLVMASHGRSGLQRWFLGSVAEDVLRRADVPVMLIRARTEGASGGATT